MERQPLREAFDKLKKPDTRPSQLQKGLNAVKRNLANSLMGAFFRWKLQALNDRLIQENDKKQHKNKRDEAMKKLMMILQKGLGYFFWSWKDKTELADQARKIQDQAAKCMLAQGLHRLVTKLSAKPLRSAFNRI